MRRILFAIFLCLTPSLSLVSADSLSAGFAPNSVWLSRTNALAGDSINIFSVLYNSSDSSIIGDLVFTVDGISVGTKSFTVGSGETQIESLPWTARVGKHTISAKIEKVLDSNTKNTVNVLNQTTGSVTVNFENPPPPPPPTPPSETTKVLSGIVSTIQNAISASAPIIADTAKTVYNTTESMRTQAKSALNKQIENNAKTTKSPDSASGPVSKTQVDKGWVPSAEKYLAGVMFAVVSSKTLFYGVLLLSLIFLFLILRMIWRERRKRRFGK